MATVDMREHLVKEGDTLWSIAKANGTTYQKLAAINGIKNPDLIYVGQRIELEPVSSSDKKATITNTATILQFGLLSTDNKTLFAVWQWAKLSTTEKFQVRWEYYLSDNDLWFIGSNSGSISVDENDPSASTQSTYQIPNGASKVRFKVKPVVRSKSSNSTASGTWTADWTSYETYDVADDPPSAPSAPSVTIEGTKLTARLDQVSEDVSRVQFKVYKGEMDPESGKYTSEVVRTASVSMSSGVMVASLACTISLGYEYMVQCRICVKGKYSEWSAYSSPQKTIPHAPTWKSDPRAASKTSIILEWNASTTASTYEIEYATSEEAFKGSNKTTKVSSIDTTTYELDGLETGHTYYFRLRATNEIGSSDWTALKSTALGSAPAAPTTWSSTTTAIVGEPLNLYWVHNTEDGSSQTYAELVLYVDGEKQLPTITIKNSTDEDEKDKTSSYSIDTSEYTEGTVLEWQVRTMGVTNTYGDFSIMRTVNIYAQPSFEVLQLTNVDGDVIETIEHFPLYLRAIAAPKTQLPVGYHVRITANETYDTVDRIGNEITVSAGDEVYSKYFDTSDDLVVVLSADNLDLANNVSYTFTCRVSMNSGLTAEESLEEVLVQWDEAIPQPNAEIGIYKDAFTAHVRPYCEEVYIQKHVVTRVGRTYEKTETIVDGTFGQITDNITTTGERVWTGVNDLGETINYCEVEVSTLAENVVLSVYRREFDGAFTELATNVANGSNTYVHDPHPSLDYARYRVVAMSTLTGAVNYYDVPGYPVNIKSVIIQWDEQWRNFDVTNEDALEQPAWSGSLLNLPYNIDISDDHKPDTSLIEYIGRQHPVSYYGTQLGSTSTWKVDIPKDDVDTLYAIRRLARWMGDVYVREPSGSGYWANITVSFSQTHRELTIPVSLKIARVEGGM